MDLNRKISLGSLLFVVTLLLGGAAALSTTRRLERTAAAVRQTEVMLDALSTTLGLVGEVESGARGYALTGRDAFLEPFRSARDRLPGALAALATLTGDNPSQRARLGELEQLIAERIGISDEHIAIRRTGGLNAAVAAVATGRGKAVMDQIRQLVTDMQAEQHRLLVERTAADHAASLQSNRVLGGVFGAAIILVLVATVLLRRVIIRRTRQLVDGLERMAAGDLRVRVDPGAQDELGRLASAFNEAVGQRRQIEEALARANTLLDSLFRAAPLAVVAIDLHGNVEVWNPAAERIFGWSADEIMGHPLPAVPDDEAKAFAEVRDRVLVGREVVAGFESKRKRRDGTLFDASSSAAPLVCNGELAGMMAVVEDITARKQSVEALRESEERFRLALDEAPIGMALVGLDGRFLRVNNVLCEIVGYSREELTGLTFQAITHPDDLAADLELAQKLARGEIPRYQLGKRYLRKDGAVVDIMLSGSIVRSRSGAPLYYIAQIEDITERKRAEEALRRSEAQLRGLIQQLPDGVYIHRDGRVIYANRALTRLLDFDADVTLVGKPIVELFHPDDFSAVEERLLLLQTGATAPPRELRMARRDGSFCSIESTAIQVQLDELPAIVVIIRDLADRKLAERAREESLRWLRVVLDVAPVGIVLSTDGRRWDGNKCAERLFGRRIDSSVDIAEYSSAILDDAEQPVAIDDLPGVRALRGEHLEAIEMRLRHSDGHIVPILLSAAPIPGGETTPPGAVVTFENISTLKALEQLRIEWNALIAHDLRQPLSSLDLNAQLVAAQTPKDSAVYKRIQLIRNQARRLNRMIQDLLDLSRLEAREFTLTRHPIRLRELVREAAERIALEAPDRRIEVHVSGDPVEVDADADRIAQVMDNLLTNAVKYGEPGTPIGVDVEARPDGVAVSVSNQGAGIAAEHLPTLFARFRRAEDAKRRGIKGIGLGLYIARALIEAHGGRIVAESTPGQRTTFRFLLPRSAPAAPALEAEQQPTAG